MYYDFSLLSYLAYRLISQSNVLIVLKDNFEAKNFYESLIFFRDYFNSNAVISFFESYSIGAVSSIAPSNETIKNRIN
ncbi:MAG: hypothetical protein AB7E28_04435, partial [Desulfurella sp.]